MSEKDAHAGCFCMGLGPQVTEMLRKLGPPESVREHFRNAQVEMLKGIRAMLDQRIEQLSRTEEKGTKVAVE